LLKSGEFGDCSSVLESYEHSCHTLFPLATTFKPAHPVLLKREDDLTNEPLAHNSPEESATTEERLGLD